MLTVQFDVSSRISSYPKTKQEIEKLGTGLNKLNEEDPTFSVTNNAETHQTVISGAGDIQILSLIHIYLHSKFKDDIRVIVPQRSMSAGTMLALSLIHI